MGKNFIIFLSIMQPLERKITINKVKMSEDQNLQKKFRRLTTLRMNSVDVKDKFGKRDILSSDFDI